MNFRLLTTQKDEPAYSPSILQAIIRVVGAEGVGKTTFIKAASDTEHSRTIPSGTVTYAVERCLCKVVFDEVLLEDFDHEEDNPTPAVDPRSGKSLASRCAGTVIVYDVMSEDSLYGVPQLLSMFLSPSLL